MSFWRPGESRPSTENEGVAAKTPKSSSALSSSASPKARSQLSDNVMGMKFMKRGADEERQEKKEAAKQQEELEDASSKRRRLSGSEKQGRGEGEREGGGMKLDVEFTVSDATSIAMYPGRRSFGGFNKIVERQYSSILEGKRLDHKYSRSAEEGDVDDEELIRRYAAMRKGKSSSSSPPGDKKNKKGNKKGDNKGDKKGRGEKSP